MAGGSWRGEKVEGGAGGGSSRRSTGGRGRRRLSMASSVLPEETDRRSERTLTVTPESGKGSRARIVKVRTEVTAVGNVQTRDQKRQCQSHRRVQNRLFFRTRGKNGR